MLNLCNTNIKWFQQQCSNLNFGSKVFSKIPINTFIYMLMVPTWYPSLLEGFIMVNPHGLLIAHGWPEHYWTKWIAVLYSALHWTSEHKSASTVGHWPVIHSILQCNIMLSSAAVYVVSSPALSRAPPTNLLRTYILLYTAAIIVLLTELCSAV